VELSLLILLQGVQCKAGRRVNATATYIQASAVQAAPSTHPNPPPPLGQAGADARHMPALNHTLS
jgi:hypothetical protein